MAPKELVKATAVRLAALTVVLQAGCSSDRDRTIEPRGACAPLEATWWSARLNQSPQLLLSPDGEQMAWRRRTPDGGAHWCVGPAGRPQEAQRYDLPYSAAGWTDPSGLRIGIVEPTRLEDLTRPGARGLAELIDHARELAGADTPETFAGWRTGTRPRFTGIWVSVGRRDPAGETLFLQTGPAQAPLRTLALPDVERVEEVLPLPGDGLLARALMEDGRTGVMEDVVHSPYGDPIRLGEFERARPHFAGWASEGHVYWIDETSHDEPRLVLLSLQTGTFTPVPALNDVPAYAPVAARDGALLAIHDDAVRPRPVGIDPSVAQGVALIEANGLITSDDLSVYLSDASRASGRALFRRTDRTGRVSYILTDAEADTAVEFTFEPGDTTLLEPYETERFKTIALDGHLVPAILHRPASLSPDAPLAVMLHGGPTAHDRMEATFDRLALLRRGLPVLVVNYRGSTGHGRAHREAGSMAFDTGMVADVVAATDEALARLGPRRVLNSGGSFGAHLAFAVSRETPERTCAAVAINPAADLLQFLVERQDRVHEGMVSYLTRLYGPWREREAAERLRAASAVTRDEDWTTPVAVIAAENDRITPPQEAERLAEAYADVLFTPYALIEDARHTPDAHQFIPVLEEVVGAALQGPCAP